ncbi:hypothetical protein [Arthrobacter sp. zg-Y1171]|uniref:hypothetical protein n=1 Tax=Arthrobacter sp. zg-Y1171 TaxID=2964610 RepID=UPI0021047FDD|nr:hypothetical protein [Arthrobacter sp. zg-Y1171]MCQ1996487.1 hypothetical protein [Arthrobacter sp. zg-Y1171]UWX82089.1 hypothetical protein N2L00_01205 [Arthrobacter sp. zg-Y1171]
MIIRAENSRGKSTAVQSILFALGLERMITNQPASALTSAMRDRLIYDASSKAETSVLSSHVTVEIEGHNGAIATVTRWVRHDNYGTNLVRVQHAALNDITSATDVDDYYVGRSGGASRERGFHVWLARFMGWSMPELPAREGRTSQLYMEQVFPLLFVEQRRGWGGIQAQMPAFSGVTEVRKRAVEFLLALEVGQYELTRQRLHAREVELAEKWHLAVASFGQSLSGSGLKLSGLPERVQTIWPDEARPAEVYVSRGDDDWKALDSYIESANAELARPSSIKAVDLDGDSNISTRIIEALDDSRRIRAMDLALREELVRQENELQAISRRIESLTEDLRQHQDIVVLQSLGSKVTEQLAEDCPVCHQHLPASLLPTDVPTMTAPESVEYIKKQLDLFSSMRSDAEQAVLAKRERWVALRQQGDALSVLVQALRDDLVGGPTEETSSAEQVAARIELRDRLQRLESVRERFDELQMQLEELATDTASIKSKLKALPKDELSDEDRQKLRDLQRSFVDQLQAYDFGSFSNDMIQIADDNYLPRRDNFDLQADISASDSVRVIWAYLLGLLEIGEQCDTNHPGLVVFDEPKQQSAKDLSFKALLRRASGDNANRQVIFATSEPLETLNLMLEGIEHSLEVVAGYLLKKLN